MSILYSENCCSLISHKDYIDKIYNNVKDARQNHELTEGIDLTKSFTIRANIFDINSSNHNDNLDENEQKRRHRKINVKKYNIEIEKNPELHKFVSKLDKEYILEPKLNLSSIFRTRKFIQNRKNS